MLTERVRRAVAPDYEILGEVAGGGMGLVFAAWQKSLARKVAIKILRPEHATAVATERFLAEGRGLAQLAHPNIVRVYDAGEADGLLYCVMEYVEGETLAQRLARGPLSRSEALRFSDDLLNALSAAHAIGIVHRDVKPANIFLRDGHALLGDFGVAHWRELQGEPPLTTPGELVGTLRYMAPEHRDGLPATPRTDVYAAGMVIWEACTGTRWPASQNPRDADWSRLPAALAVPVRRALELDPEQRWADAREFAAVLGGRPRTPRALLALAAVLLLGLATWAVWPLTKPEPSLRLPLELGRIATHGATQPGEQDLGDSAAANLRERLSGNPDFYVTPLGQRSEDPRALRLDGEAHLAAGQLRLAVRERSVPEGAERVAASETGAAAVWQDVVDAVAADLIYQVWTRAKDDRFFPANAIPPKGPERARLVQAEQFFSLGRWEDARRVYTDIESGCLLCTFRSLDIARWFGLPQDPGQLSVLQRAQDSFPDHYRSLIRAYALPTQRKLDALEQAAADYSTFYLAPFEYGDELFHRGPLFGRLRAEAIEPLRTALLYHSDFQPGLEHLTWLLIAEGDSAGAARELNALLRLPIVSGLSGGLTLLRRLGFYWRFLPVEDARRFSARLLLDSMVINNQDAAAAARLLMTMDAPRGAVEFGAMLADWPARRDATLHGLLGRLYGYAALGKLDSLRLTGGRLAHASVNPSYRLLALELEAVLRALDPDTQLRAGGQLREALVAEARRVADDPELRQRAMWALGLLAAQIGDSASLALAWSGLNDEPEPRVLGTILRAVLLGKTDARGALDLLPTIPTLDQGIEYADPLEDAVVHLLRAEWQERLGSMAQASRTLRWHEHTQISGHLNSPRPQPGEMAWALGTLARWKRAKVLAALEDHGAEWCSVNRDVARLWSDADPAFLPRANSARAVLTSKTCSGAP